MRETISVALATYNGEPYLRAQLDSIQRQSRPPDELVIGDDCSSDGTADIVADFATGAKFPVRFTRNDVRLGSSENFVRILMRCSGDLVVLSDQDDVWSERRLARSEEVMQEHPHIAYVFSNASLIDSFGMPVAGTLWERVFFGPVEQRNFASPERVLLKTNVVTGATMAIRRRVIHAALPVAPGWVHDGWLAFLLGVLYGAVAVNEPWIAYRVHAAQQVGLVDWSPRSLLASIRRQDAAFYRAESAKYLALSERVRELGPEYGSVSEALRQKADFLERRAASRESFAKCIRGLYGSLKNGDYLRYGLGYKQAVLDLVSASDAATQRAIRL